MTRAVVLFLFVLGYVNCNLIKIDQDIGTKDVPILREDVDSNYLKPAAPEEIDTEVLPVSVNLDSREPKKCAKIGEFCSYHSECCTRSCLGYSKRCVTGSVYPDYIDPLSV